MNLTKKIICDALLELAQVNRIDKISVSMIIEKSGISKPTFYNHFRDKYDLVAWIFAQDVIDSSVNTSFQYSVDELCKTLNRLYERKEFYKNALSIQGQNSLISCIHEHTMNLNSKILKESSSSDFISEEMHFALTYHSYGCIGYIVEWLRSDNPMSPEKLAQLEYEYMPDFLRKAWTSKKTEA